MVDPCARNEKDAVMSSCCCGCSVAHGTCALLWAALRGACVWGEWGWLTLSFILIPHISTSGRASLASFLLLTVVSTGWILESRRNLGCTAPLAGMCSAVAHQCLVAVVTWVSSGVLRKLCLQLQLCHSGKRRAFLSTLFSSAQTFRHVLPENLTWFRTGMGQEL